MPFARGTVGAAHRRWAVHVRAVVKSHRVIRARYYSLLDLPLSNCDSRWPTVSSPGGPQGMNRPNSVSAVVRGSRASIALRYGLRSLTLLRAAGTCHMRQTCFMAHDLVTLGEVLLRLAIPSPARFETARQLDVQIGGAEANVAAACARLGVRTAWISAVPENEWGGRIIAELSGHGVDCSYVRRMPDARVGVYFLEYGVPPRPTRVLYDRRDSAFARLPVDVVDWRPVREAKIVHLSGVTAALGTSGRALVRKAIAEAQAVSFDVNYRAALWSPASARTFIDEVLPVARYVFLGESEARLVFGLDGSPEAVVEACARLAPNATITLLRGADGSITVDSERLIRPRRRHAVDVVDPVGAGDAFAAGFLWASLRNQSIDDVVDVANAVAAIKCSTWGDIALVTPRDVEEVLAGGPDVRR